MRTRAIADLAQLDDSAFFEEVSLGMLAVLRNARGLLDDARVLFDAGRLRSAELLSKVAEEEGAKYHILLDAVRCSRKSDAFPRQLRRFNDHLSKGIYSEYLWMAPASYGEVLSFLEGHRQTLYLDGPNDVDWIFTNSILREREEAMYVDYVEMDGKHQWTEPRTPPTAGMGFLEPRSISLAVRLSRAGFDKPQSLAMIAELWRGVEFATSDHWQRCNELNLRTLEVLAEHGLLSPEGEAEARRIAWDWLFPLHAADLSRIEVDLKELKAVQRAWHPW